MFEKRIYRNNSWSAWSSGDGRIGSGDSVQLRWTGTNVDKCRPKGDGFRAYTTQGYDWAIDEPSRNRSETYQVICTGDGGTVTETIIITNDK